ncbi:10517_t:CDS:2, partial [Gigaspora margarita]
VEIAYLSIDLLGIRISNDDYEYKGRKSKQKVSSKPKKRRPTISKVLKSQYALEKETPMIFTCENSTISINAAYQMILLQETVNKIDAEKDIPKELIESLKAELNRVNTIGLNSQNTEVDNIIKGITVKENKTHDLTDQELYYQDEIGLEKAYEDWKKRINKRQINDNTNKVKKDKHEVFKSYKRPTEPNERTQVKDRLKTFSYCQEYTEMKHIDETIEGYFKNRTSIEANIGSNSTNDLERTCEVWKKKVEMLKGITKKSKDKDQNETKKQEEYK